MPLLTEHPVRMIVGLLLIGSPAACALAQQPRQYQLSDASFSRPRSESGFGPSGNLLGFQSEESESGEAESPEFEFENEEESEIETDRDSFTPSTSTVGWRRTVVESAYSFIDNRDVAETHSFPELLVRYGISDRLELRLGWNYETGGIGSPISGNVPGNSGEAGEELERSSRLLYGAKLNLTEQRLRMPANSFIIQGFTPTYGEPSRSQLSATHVFGWELPNGWVWDFANRYGTSGDREDYFNTWASSSVIKVPIGSRWKGHVEYIAEFTDGRETETTQYFFSPGAHYLVNENFEIGLRVGWGLNDQSADFFSNVGIGWRF